MFMGRNRQRIRAAVTGTNYWSFKAATVIAPSLSPSRHTRAVPLRDANIYLYTGTVWAHWYTDDASPFEILGNARQSPHQFRL